MELAINMTVHKYLTTAIPTLTTLQMNAPAPAPGGDICMLELLQNGATVEMINHPNQGLKTVHNVIKIAQEMPHKNAAVNYGI